MDGKLFKEIANGVKFVCLHNGYSAFSYGCPHNPLIFDYKEFQRLDSFLKKMFQYDILATMPTTEMKHVHVNKDVKEFLGFDIIGVYTLKECVYDDSAEKEKSQVQKKRILDICN